MRYALALILVVGLTATANADAWTWFSLESDAGLAAADKGAVLQLDPTTDGAITVHQWVEVEDPMEFTGMSSDLLYGDDSGVFTIDDYSIDVGTGTMGYWLTQQTPAVGATGVEGYGALFFVASLETYITEASGVQHVGSFDITVDNSAIGGQLRELLGGIGYNLWAQTGGLAFDVHYGATVVGSQDTATNAPVIAIPEPSTLALLGFGALALIRRR